MRRTRSEEVVELLRRNGYTAIFLPFSRFEEVKNEILELHKSRKLDKEFYDEWMPTYLDAKPPKSMPNPRSILLVSTGNRQRIVTFRLDGRVHRFIVPPTYGMGPKVRSKVRSILRGKRGKMPFRAVNANPPLKLLAVKSGLAMYGRNNITYVPGLGSFHRLIAFYTDVEAPEGNWSEKISLPKCGRCRACLAACPTHAIDDDRFLLRAERCLTCLNERDSSHEFPSWVKQEWHNAIVGCMICQRVCPYNRDFVDQTEDGPCFSEEETRFLLSGRYKNKKGVILEKKLKLAGLDLSIFPRNLQVLLGKPSPT